MAREPQTKSIDGHRYTVQMLPAMLGQEMLQDILRIALPTVGALVGQANFSGGLKALLEKELNIERACLALMASHDKQMVTNIIRQMADQTTVDDKMKLLDVFDTWFQGEYGAMVKWLTFALGVNFDRFLSLIGSTAGQSGPTAAAVAEKV